MEELRKFWPFSDIPSESISIYEGPRVFLDDYNQATLAEQIAFSAFWLQAEVLNGGLEQFFDNDTGVLAPEAVSAFQTLGLPLLASELQKAMLWFGQPYPRDRENRQSALSAFKLAHPDSDPFLALDDRLADLIYSESGGLEDTVSRYLRSLAT